MQMKAIQKHKSFIIAVGILLFLFLYHSSSPSELKGFEPELIDPVTVDSEDDEPVSKQKPICPVPPFDYIKGGRSSVISLASFPGSGNTWIRHLLQRGSGFLTGSVYNDLSLLDQFPGETVRDSRVIAVKTHYPCANCWLAGPPEKRYPVREIQSGIVMNNKASIQVLRSPFGAMLSDFNHKQSGANHTGVASEEAFKSEIFDLFVQEKMKTWTRHAQFYLKKKSSWDNQVWMDEKGRPVLLIYYEALKSEPVKNLKKMFEFIKKYSPQNEELAKLDPEQAALCAIKGDAVGRFKRIKPDNKPFEKLLSDQTTTVRQMACRYFQTHCQDFWKFDDKEWDCPEFVRG